MNKSLTTSTFKSSLMAALLAGAFSAHGAGLGKLSVYSGIGQQLKAEVALSATPAELNSMTAKMASPDAFREAGVEYSQVMSDVRIELEKNAAGEPILKLSSVRPVTEPFLHFLVELSWTSGRMVREYTFLLDPPELLQVAKPASVVTPAMPATKPLPAPTQPGVATAKPASAAKPAVPAAGEYQVKLGDSLGKIARETKSDSVSLDQMLVALFNSNQEAFSGNNMNRLRAGRILRVPSAEEASQIDPAAARKIVVGQAGEFNAYRNRLAGAVAEAPKFEEAPQQQVSGAIKPQVEDKAPPPAAKDKLEVSRTEPVKAGQPGSSLEEDLIAREKALREASERIVLLEKNIENLKKLVEVKSQAGAELQQQAKSSTPAATDKPAEDPKVEAPTAPVPPVPAAPATEPPGKTESAKPVEPVTPPPVARKPITPPPPPEPSFMDENPEIMYGGGGLVALLLAYLGYSSARRKKQQAQNLEEEAPLPPSLDKKETTVGAGIAVAPALVDSGEISIQGDFSESGLLTNEEIVDPVAEADVLMAYGRDRQAEEILQEGLNKDPSRPAIHMKLLDLYAKQENLAGYEGIAQKLHALNNGRGADWEKALAVGRTLGLSGGIFAAGGALAAAVKQVSDVIEPTPTVEPPAVETATAGAVAGSPINAPFADETHSLEFDLDLGTSSTGSAAVAAEKAIAAAPVEEDFGLDFDFDLGSPEAKEAVEAVVEQAAAADKNILPDIDFDLDLGSPVETGSTSIKLADSEAGSDLSELPAGGIGDLKLDFDLDLDQEPASNEGSVSSANALSAQMDNPEVATKLELAQAYEEMGDLEGARELLKEVTNEGSEAQQAKAREKLEQLSA